MAKESSEQDSLARIVTSIVILVGIVVFGIVISEILVIWSGVMRD